MPPGTGGRTPAWSWGLRPWGVITVLAVLGWTCIVIVIVIIVVIVVVFLFTWTTPVSEVGGTGWVGSLATAAM